MIPKIRVGVVLSTASRLSACGGPLPGETGIIDKDGGREKATGKTRGSEDEVFDSLAAA